MNLLKFFIFIFVVVISSTRTSTANSNPRLNMKKAVNISLIPRTFPFISSDAGLGTIFWKCLRYKPDSSHLWNLQTNDY